MLSFRDQITLKHTDISRQNFHVLSQYMGEKTLCGENYRGRKLSVNYQSPRERWNDEISLPLPALKDVQI